MPSKKWWAATVVALGTVGSAWAQAGAWNETLSVAAIGLVVQRVTAWLVSNGEDES